MATGNRPQRVTEVTRVTPADFYQAIETGDAAADLADLRQDPEDRMLYATKALAFYTKAAAIATWLAAPEV